MTNDDAIKILSDLDRRLETSAASYRRKRKIRPSELAMTLASIARDREALALASAALKIHKPAL